MLYALADGSRIIKREHLEAAYAMWKYCDASACHLFGESLGNPKAERILNALRSRPEGMTKGEIHLALFKGHLKAALLEEALELLKTADWIELKREETGGRPGERFFVKQRC